MVASAGSGTPGFRHYPAAYDEAVGVTATNQSDNCYEYSNFGDWFEVAAPGIDTYSLFLDDSYTYMSGTSMSAAHVTAPV